MISILSEDCILISCGNNLDIDINNDVIRLHQFFLHHSFKGIIETVPSYTTLAIYIDVIEVQRTGQLPIDYVKTILQNEYVKKEHDINKGSKHIEIPVSYTGPDLEWVASHNDLTINELIDLHCNETYHIFMIGFQPGFPYMGITNEKLNVPRKLKPVNVIPGSVAIAGRQTGIYPHMSPGGWQVIGFTKIPVVNADNAKPFLLSAGDTVKFFAI